MVTLAKPRSVGRARGVRAREDQVRISEAGVWWRADRWRLSLCSLSEFDSLVQGIERSIVFVTRSPHRPPFAVSTIFFPLNGYLYKIVACG